MGIVLPDFFEGNVKDMVNLVMTTYPDEDYVELANVRPTPKKSISIQIGRTIYGDLLRHKCDKGKSNELV